MQATPLGGVSKGINDLEKLSKKSISTVGDNTVKKIPLVGDVLVGNEKKGGLFSDILKKTPLIGNRIAEDEVSQGLINVYFRVEGTFDEPNVYFLPKKTFFIK